MYVDQMQQGFAWLHLMPFLYRKYFGMNIVIQVVPLRRHHKKSPRKTVSQRGFVLLGG